MNTYGKIFRVTTWGESHGPAVGCVIDGCPSKIKLDEKMFEKDIKRRKTGQSKLTSARKESDKVNIMSGIFEGQTTGTPISLIVYNEDQRSKDYNNIKNIFRPGHADYAYYEKYGIRDYRGGGRASGRETVARVIAGVAAKQVLPDKIKFAAYTKQVGDIVVQKIDLKQIEKNAIRCPDAGAAKKMIKLIEKVKSDDDSIGGVVELVIQNVPAGLGEPVFDKLNAELAKALMSIGAVKGVEFGAGFSVAERKGSENNDVQTPLAPLVRGGSTRVQFQSNNAGGTLGGISTGQDIVVRLAIKPTSSISKKQQAIDLKGRKRDIKITGRHDPCICPRVIPVVEAMAALALVDFYLMDKVYK